MSRSFSLAIQASRICWPPGLPISVLRIFWICLGYNRSTLVAGRLRGPSCAGMLRPWGRSRERGDRLLGTVTVRLDRARCRSCRATYVALPAGLVAGRSYSLGVIGPALVAVGQG